MTGSHFRQLREPRIGADTKSILTTKVPVFNPKAAVAADTNLPKMYVCQSGSTIHSGLSLPGGYGRHDNWPVQATKCSAEKEPWKLAKTDMDSVGNILLIYHRSVPTSPLVCEPFLPFTAKQLRTMLNVEEATWDKTGKSHHVKVRAFPRGAAITV